MDCLDQWDWLDRVDTCMQTCLHAYMHIHMHTCTREYFLSDDFGPLLGHITTNILEINWGGGGGAGQVVEADFGFSYWRHFMCHRLASFGTYRMGSF